MTVEISSRKCRIWINNIMIDSIAIFDNSNTSLSAEEKGFLVVAINLKTCKRTLAEIINTNLAAVYRTLSFIQNSISSGRLILIVSLFDSSTALPKRNRNKVTSLRSLWSDFYMYRDTLVNFSIKGGLVLADLLVPNVGTIKHASSPARISIDLPPMPIFEDDYSNWPNSFIWQLRRKFCGSYDGYKSICDSVNPLEWTKAGEFNENEDIPISILASDRPMSLVRLLETLILNDDLKRNSLVIFLDGLNEEVVLIARIMRIKIIIHRKEGYSGNSKISRALRFVLYHQLKDFPRSNYFIHLEDDIIVSPDFYSYMKHASSIFSLDESVLCVSAFNVMSYKHNSLQPTVLYRGPNFPQYGWMLPRRIIEEILPKWTGVNEKQDWDFFVQREDIGKNRICIEPDVLRANHISVGGMHYTSANSEKHFLQRTLNNNIVKLPSMHRYIKQQYENDTKNLLSQAIPINLDENMYNINLIKGKEKIYSIFVKKPSDGMRSLCLSTIYEAMNLWSLGFPHVPDARRLFYNGAIVLIVMVPSKYSFALPQNYTFLAPYKCNQIINKYEETPHMTTHQEYKFLPEIAY